METESSAVEVEAVPLAEVTDCGDDEDMRENVYVRENGRDGPIRIIRLSCQSADGAG
jgi:hypothetical protein